MYKPIIMVGDVFQENSTEYPSYDNAKLTVTRITSGDTADERISPSPNPLWIKGSSQEENQWIYYTLDRKVHAKTEDRARFWWIRDHFHRIFIHDEESILLYAESCLVDNYGKMKACKMNGEDMKALDRFKMEGLLDYGRIPFEDIKKSEMQFGNTHWIRFTDEAWAIVHNLRRQRADRMIMKSYGTMASLKNE